MRTFTFLLALGLVGTSFAAPIAQPEPLSPALFVKDPFALHRRSVPVSVSESESEPAPAPAPVEQEQASTSAVEVEVEAEAEVATEGAEDKAEEACAAVCGVRRVEGARSEREALCSVEGLRATSECAQCIDQTWPETTWEDSAMAEYERIASACGDTPQTPFRRAD